MLFRIHQRIKISEIFKIPLFYIFFINQIRHPALTLFLFWKLKGELDRKSHYVGVKKNWQAGFMIIKQTQNIQRTGLGLCTRLQAARDSKATSTSRTNVSKKELTSTKKKEVSSTWFNL